MKKPALVLSLAFAAAVSACQQQPKEPEWITGAGSGGATRDTVRNGRSYRHYQGSWFPIYAGLISPGLFRGGSAQEIGRPGYVPGRVSGSSIGRSSGIRSGGFGSSAHSSFGS